MNLAWGIYLYVLHSGLVLPFYMYANLKHGTIPQSEIDKFRAEWIKYYEEVERKLNDGKQN